MSQAAKVLSFRNHVHPEEVTQGMRDRICRELLIDQIVWSSFIGLLTALLIFGLMLVERFAPHPPLTWYLGTIVALALWAELICYFVYDRRKKFVQESRATTALVIKQRGTKDYEATIPSIRVRYVPTVERYMDIEYRPEAREAIEAWAALDGLSSEFEKSLHVGDLVTILYDPARPSHVRVVEVEH